MRSNCEVMEVKKFNNLMVIDYAGKQIFVEAIDGRLMIRVPFLPVEWDAHGFRHDCASDVNICKCSGTCKCHWKLEMEV